MKTIKVLTLAIALVLGMASTASADYLPSNKTQADQVDSLDLMVQYLERDAFVPSRLEFRQISADPVADLVDIATGHNPTKVRNRAVQALALYRNDDRAVQTVESMLDKMHPGQKLFPALIVAYGQIAGEQSVEKIAPYATNRRREVRMAAVVALGRFGGTAGYEVLAGIADAEQHPAIRARIENYIR